MFASFTWPLALSEALALEDDLVGIVREAAECALGEDRIGEEGDPFFDRAIADDDRGGSPVASRSAF